MQAIVVPTRYF